VGLIATAFNHRDSRAGDPHLHTHVVISNKVQTAIDGKWRSLDGRPMHAAVVALSELHETLFADALTHALGVQWERRERGRYRHPAWAIASVPEALVAEFSTGTQHIDLETDRLIDAYVSAHGRRPNPATVMKLRAQAALSTRPPKEVRSLADLSAEWRGRAAAVLGRDATSWASIASGSRPPLVLGAEQIPRDTIEALGHSVMMAVSEKRATWRHWNIAAEAARQTMHYRFTSAVSLLRQRNGRRYGSRRPSSPRLPEPSCERTEHRCSVRDTPRLTRRRSYSRRSPGCSGEPPMNTGRSSLRRPSLRLPECNCREGECLARTSLKRWD
jgi:hypothetical protein